MCGGGVIVIRKLGCWIGLVVVGIRVGIYLFFINGEREGVG